MSVADRLASLKIDMAIWSEESEGYKRVAFSPAVWPAIVELVLAAETYVDIPDDKGRNTYGIELALEALEAALR